VAVKEYNLKPQKNSGFKRIWRAFFYSLAGLKSALKEEEAFRQELLLSIVLLPILLFISVPLYLKWLLLFAHVVILVAELLNSAVEATVDLASPQYHELAKQAKDLGSAAVLLTFIPAAGLWTYVIYRMVFL